MERIWMQVLLVIAVPARAISASHAGGNVTHVQFDVTSRTMCAPSSERFRGIQGVTLKQCVLRCSMRPRCEAVNYRRKFQLCELFANDSLPLEATGGCVYVTRTNIKLPACNCSLGEVCHSHTGACSFQECTPFSLTNGVIYGNMYSIGSRLMFTCNAGYLENSSMSTTTCLSSGQWQYIPQCSGSGSGCGEPPDMDNATVDAGTTNAESVRTYACTAGYSVFDPPRTMTTKCDGTMWTTPDFQCLRDCGPVYLTVGVVPDNGTYPTTEGTSLTVNCSEGSAWTLSCLGNGSWSYGDNICSIGCGDPPEIGNATVTAGKTGPGEMRMYACVTGYSVQDPPQDMTITCDGVTSTWTPTQFQCLRDCGPITLTSGTLMVSGPYGTTDSSYHAVECDDGYTWGIYCLTNGTWWYQDTCDYGMIGGTCVSFEDCQSVSGVCINSTCFCPPTYSFEYHTANCVKKCESLSEALVDHASTRVSNRYFTEYVMEYSSSTGRPSCVDDCEADDACLGVVSASYGCIRISATYDMLADADPSSLIPGSGYTYHSRRCE